MSKHTPGPWTFGHWGNDFWVGTQPNGLSGKVARVLWGMGEGVEEGRENARLIAAAPDLLEEAKEQVAWLRHIRKELSGVARESILLGIDQSIKALSAAIAKAEGKS